MSTSSPASTSRQPSAVGRMIDTHHHLWDLDKNYYPWLTDKIEPKPYGDYSAIRRNYLIKDFFADIGDLPLVKSVHVNGDHDHNDPVRETAWLQSVADDKNSRGFPHAIVADASLTREDLPALLEAHCAYRNMRGVRSILSPIVTANRPNVLEGSAWWDGLKMLARFDLSLDLQIHPLQMPRIAEAVRQHPKIGFIVCHTGFLNYKDPAMVETWDAGMRMLAAFPNVALKISGFMVWDLKWTVDSIRPTVLRAIEIFGSERCMFASNYPPDRLAATYEKIWRSFEEITRDFSPDERDAMFYENACRYYRI